MKNRQEHVRDVRKRHGAEVQDPMRFVVRADRYAGTEKSTNAVLRGRLIIRRETTSADAVRMKRVGLLPEEIVVQWMNKHPAIIWEKIMHLTLIHVNVRVSKHVKHRHRT